MYYIWNKLYEDNIYQLNVLIDDMMYVYHVLNNVHGSDGSQPKFYVGNKLPMYTI